MLSQNQIVKSNEPEKEISFSIVKLGFLRKLDFSLFLKKMQFLFQTK